MNQHHVQKAYLKNFSGKDGKVWVHEKNLKRPYLKPVSQCTIEEDFQSEFLEKYQSTIIESPGIRALRKLPNAQGITEADFESAKYWTALHCIRNKRYRSMPRVDYESNFRQLIEIEKKFSRYYSYCFKYKCDEGKYLVTSDNPILEFTIGEYCIRILTLSPSELLTFSPIDGIPTHEELEFTEFVNSMLWANSSNQVFSNQKELPILIYERNIKNWNLEPRFEDVQFKVLTDV